MRVFNRIGTAFLSIAMIAAISCSSKESENASGVKIIKASDPNALKLAFVTNNASEFWKIAAAGVHKYEKEAGVQVDIKMPPNGKTEEQNGYLENLVSQGYNGIAVSVIAPADSAPPLLARGLG